MIKDSDQIFPIRFSIQDQQMQWCSNYGWLFHDRKWYLIDLLSPQWLYKCVPWLLSRRWHKTWLVDSDTVLDTKSLDFRPVALETRPSNSKTVSIATPAGAVGGAAAWC